MPQIIQGLAAGTQVKSPTISTLSHTDNLHAQVISIPHPLPPIPPHLQHLVCPGRVFRELTATRFRCFSWCWGAGERLPQTHTQQESISLTMALRGLSGHVGGGRSHGLFLFYAHPVTLATENKRRQSTTYHTLMHGEAWEWRKHWPGSQKASIPPGLCWLLASCPPASHLLLGPALDRMRAGVLWMVQGWSRRAQPSGEKTYWFCWWWLRAQELYRSNYLPASPL